MALNLSAAPQGKQTLDVNFGGTTLETFTYRPAGEIKGVLLNFHGTSRDAEGARDAAIKMADAKGLYVVSPLFEEADFSNKKYQMGGIVSDSGNLRWKSDWTVSIVDDIAEWAHAKVGNDPRDETIGFGHSGGAQFLSRVAAFGPDIFDKIIVTNASNHVRASLSEDLPYGFNGLSTTDQQAYLKDYLADPITIYAGSEDDDSNAADLATGSAAMRQGDDRLERAEFVYDEAKAFAASKGWAFNWEFVVANGVTHSARKMFNAPEFQKAFDGRAGASSVSTSDTARKLAGDALTFDTSADWNGTVIADFAKGDVFDFRGIDANTTKGGGQAFEFIGLAGSDAFTTDGAEIRVRHSQGDTYLYLNTDGDTFYEAKGVIEGIHDLTASDFLL